MAVWPDWAILKVFGNNISNKSSPKDIQLFGQCWKTAVSCKNCCCYFLCNFYKHMGYVLLQHLVTLFGGDVRLRVEVNLIESFSRQNRPLLLNGVENGWAVDFLKLSVSGLSFCLFSPFQQFQFQLMVNKICRWLDSNCRTLVPKVTGSSNWATTTASEILSITLGTIYTQVRFWSQIRFYDEIAENGSVGPIPASFYLFSSFSHYNLNNTNWKSVDGVLGIWTRSRWMVGADETTELWWFSRCLKRVRDPKFFNGNEKYTYQVMSIYIYGPCDQIWQNFTTSAKF